MHRNLNNQHHRYARTFVLHWRTFTIFNLEVKINSTDLQQENNIAINQQHITVTMARVLFFLALLIATASAFVVPVQHAVSSPAFVKSSSSAQQMIPMEKVEAAFTSVIAQNTNLIATNADEFGGYFYPVAGIALLAVLILYLSPPLAD